MKTNPTIVKETPDYIKLMYLFGSSPEFSRQNKYLCLGGPFDKQRKAAHQLGQYTPKVATTRGLRHVAYGGYIPFNCASGRKVTNKRERVSAVWIWEGLFT